MMDTAGERCRGRARGNFKLVAGHPLEGVCVVVRLESRYGEDRKLAALMEDFALRVRDEEPDCTSHVVTRTIGSREHFAAHAHFSSWDAFNAHAETLHLARVLPRLTALLAAPISMEIFLELPRSGGEFRVGDAWREVETQSQGK